MTALSEFWEGYDRTLKRIGDEEPQTLAAVAAILNDFQPPSAGVAFFGNNGDEHLSVALMGVGWDVRFIEHDYLWEATSPIGDTLHYVEGDIYPGLYRAPGER